MPDWAVYFFVLFFLDGGYAGNGLMIGRFERLATYFYRPLAFVSLVRFDVTLGFTVDAYILFGQMACLASLVIFPLLPLDNVLME